jgi:hypothetical protein
MRLLPTAGEGTFRVSKQDVQLGDLTVPAGQCQVAKKDARIPSTLALIYVIALLPWNGSALWQTLCLAACCAPAGVFIWSFFLGTFTHPDVWDDPDSFQPVSLPTSQAADLQACLECRSASAPHEQSPTAISMACAGALAGPRLRVCQGAYRERRWKQAVQAPDR